MKVPNLSFHSHALSQAHPLTLRGVDEQANCQPSLSLKIYPSALTKYFQRSQNHRSSTGSNKFQVSPVFQLRESYFTHYNASNRSPHNPPNKNKNKNTKNPSNSHANQTRKDGMDYFLFRLNASFPPVNSCFLEVCEHLGQGLFTRKNKNKNKKNKQSPGKCYTPN